MNKQKAFFAFLESLKTPSNTTMIESIKAGYSLMEGEMSDLEDQVNFGEETITPEVQSPKPAEIRAEKIDNALYDLVDNGVLNEEEYHTMSVALSKLWNDKTGGSFR